MGESFDRTTFYPGLWVGGASPHGRLRSQSTSPLPSGAPTVPIGRGRIIE